MRLLRVPERFQKPEAPDVSRAIRSRDVLQIAPVGQLSVSCFRAAERGSKMPLRPAGNITQDWEPVVLNRRKPKAADLRDPKAVNQALRAGATVEAVKKHDAGSNRKGSSAAAGPVVNARKLDEQTEAGALDRVSGEVKQAIQKARVAKKMSQVDLAKAICEKPQVVQEYESGKAVPNQAVLAKMERALGVKLRGKPLK